MFKKLIEFNQATQVWWEKQQGKLTKTQHIILTVLCLSYYSIIAFGTNENGEATFFGYFLPFFAMVCIGGSFCGNALFYGKFKKKK